MTNQELNERYERIAKGFQVIEILLMMADHLRVQQRRWDLYCEELQKYEQITGKPFPDNEDIMLRIKRNIELLGRLSKEFVAAVPKDWSPESGDDPFAWPKNTLDESVGFYELCLSRVGSLFAPNGMLEKSRHLGVSEAGEFAKTLATGLPEAKNSEQKPELPDI